MSAGNTGQVHTPTFGKVVTDLLHDLTITDGAKVLYAHMYWRYGDNCKNFEGQKSMAAMLGVSEKTIRNRLDELEANDWIITIYMEGHDKNGNWQRCHYHVFETQEACRRFRADYVPMDAQKIKPKPVAKGRISRKGKGNTEAIPPRRKPSSNGDRRKPSSAPRRKPSSTYLDSGYLDSVFQWRYFVPPLLAALAEVLDPNRRHKKRLASDDLYATAAMVWDTSAEGFLNNVTAQLRGVSKKGEWAEANISPEVTADELIGWAKWYKRQNDILPMKPERIQFWMDKYRRAVAARRPQAQPDKVLNLPSEDDPNFAKAMMAELMRVNGMVSQ